MLILGCWRSQVFAQIQFKEVTSKAGIYMRAAESNEAGPGVVVGDLDGDGWDDIYMPGGEDSDKLFLNMHDGTFKNIAPPNVSVHQQKNGGSYRAWESAPRGGIIFDYDNDGYNDIYSCCENRDILWHNNKDGTYTDVTRVAQLDVPLDRNESMSATFGDFNGDGTNDIYVARWVNEYKFTADSHGNNTVFAHKGFPNWFYVNNGDGSFTESGKAFGVDGDTGTTNIAIFFDYDRDGDLDLLIGNDFGWALTPNQVFKNMLMETGEAKFVDVSDSIGMKVHLFCMGIGPNDYDRDGSFDFYMTSFGPDSLMHNNGKNIFHDVSKRVLPHGDGLMSGGSALMATTWTALMGDYDNDGWEDGFIVHGSLGLLSQFQSEAPQKDTSTFYHNIQGYFEDVTPTVLDGYYIDFKGRGAGFLDFNHDGKLDICVGSLGFDPGIPTNDFRLLQNIASPSDANPSHWLEMRFIAKRTAKEAIGTIVDVWAGGEVSTRQVSTGGGFGSQNSLTQHVGLGEHEYADSIIVYWPCDKYRHRQIDKYLHVQADNIVTYIETVSGVKDIPMKSEVEIYPQPANDYLHVKNISPSGSNRIEIFDLLGNRSLEIYSSDANVSLPISQLSVGCYVLKITGEKSVIIRQFIKD